MVIYKQKQIRIMKAKRKKERDLDIEITNPIVDYSEISKKIVEYNKEMEEYLRSLPPFKDLKTVNKR